MKMNIERQSLLRRLTELQYRRNDLNFVRGTFRVRGDNIEFSLLTLKTGRGAFPYLVMRWKRFTNLTR